MQRKDSICTLFVLLKTVKHLNIKRRMENNMILRYPSPSNYNVKFWIFALPFFFSWLHIATIHKLLCTLPICGKSPKSANFLLGPDVNLQFPDSHTVRCEPVTEWWPLDSGHQWSCHFSAQIRTWRFALHLVLLSLCHLKMDHKVEIARILEWPWGMRSTNIRLWYKWK